MPNRWFTNWGQVVQAVCVVIATFLSIGNAYPDLRNNHLFTAGTLLLYALVALVVITGIAWFRAGLAREKPIQDGAGPRGELLVKAVWEMLRTHVKVYKELAATYPVEARYPLNHSSWPNFGVPWTGVQAALFAESTAFNRTLAVMRAAWNDLGWQHSQEIFGVSAQTTMTSLLTALEDVDYFLRSKVKVLET